MKKALALLVLALMIGTAIIAQDAKFSVSKDDTIRNVLSKQAGSKVTLRLDSGEEMSGTVKMVGDKVVHLSELTGKEYYDAVIDLEEVAAVIVRAR
jgi:hypothetical protein